MPAAIIYETAALFALLAQARSAGGDTAMSLVTTDISRYVADPKAALVRTKIAGSQWKPRDERTETGTVTLRVITAYRSVPPVLKADDTFEIEGVRTTDPMNRQLDLRNPWNVLPLEPNEELLLALHAGPSSRLWIPLAMAPFDGNDSALREAIAIEALPARERLPRLEKALPSDTYLLRAYALSELKHKDVATREQAAAAIAQAFESTKSVNARLALFTAMEGRDYFQEELGPDPANVAILSAWLKVILREGDKERRASFLNHLAAAIGSKLDDDPAKDRALRARLAAAIHDPPQKQVAAMFRAAAAANPGDARYKRLAEAWGG